MGCRCSKAEDKDLAAERKRISSIKVQPLELRTQNKCDQAINQDEYNNWEPKRTSIRLSLQMNDTKEFIKTDLVSTDEWSPDKTPRKSNLRRSILPDLDEEKSGEIT